LASWLADIYGPHPTPYYLGIPILVLAFYLVHRKVHDTQGHVQIAEKAVLFMEPSYKNRNTLQITMAGLINNLNDGVLWVLLPMLFLQQGYSLMQMGLLIAIYPATWGMAQLFTGVMGDRWSHRRMLSYGMLLQAIAIAFLIYPSIVFNSIALFLIGFGTALVYPIFLGHLAGITAPKNRPGVLTRFRFWRDLGYAIGAALALFILESIGILPMLLWVAALTALSGISLLIFFQDNSTAMAIESTKETCKKWKEVQNQIATGAALLIDVRSVEEYKKHHLDAALHFPLTELEQNKPIWSASLPIYTICGKGGGQSVAAAELLRLCGYKHVYSVCGGMNEISDSM
jgi:MFS family permease